MRSLCLEAFAPRHFRPAMAALLRSGGLPVSARVLDVLETRLANASSYATHSTSHLTGFALSNSAHKRIVRRHDANLFGGFYANAERELGCGLRSRGTTTVIRDSQPELFLWMAIQQEPKSPSHATARSDDPHREPNVMQCP